MKTFPSARCLVAFFLTGLAVSRCLAEGGGFPVPNRAKEFVDPAELIVRSAPAGALQRLTENTDEPWDKSVLTEINHWFGHHVMNKSVVLHTTVEAIEPHPGTPNAFRLRVASSPVHLDGGSIQRLSYLYFDDVDAPAPGSVAVGSEITVVGWIRHCEMVMTPEGLRFYFDLRTVRILSAAPASVTAGAPGFPGGGEVETRSWRQGEEPVRLIRKEEGFCALSLVTGSFQGAGEHVRVWIAEDGYWYLGGESHQEGVGAECIIVRYGRGEGGRSLGDK
jgi:hypothetical protein